MKVQKWHILLTLVLTLALGLWFYIKKTAPENHKTQQHIKENTVHLIQFSEEQVQELELEILTAQEASLAKQIRLTGEIKINEDNLAHIVAYSSGIVKQVNNRLGDLVTKGQILALLDAPEISSLQEEYLEAIARLAIAETNFQREEKLLEENLTIESDFLKAKDEQIRAEHDLHSTKRKLRIFGFSDYEIANLKESHQANSSYYKIVAPYSGTIIEKDISLGEAIDKNAKIFSIADISTVWVDFSLYQKDIAYIKEGQLISIDVPNFNEDITGTISFVSPLLGEGTRTAFARVVLENPNSLLKPGTFVTGQVEISGASTNSLLIKKTAVQEIEGNKVIFIKTEEGFKPQIVELGQANDTQIEVLSGINPGEDYVAENSFILKAELQKDELKEGHGH